MSLSDRLDALVARAARRLRAESVSEDPAAQVLESFRLAALDGDVAAGRAWFESRPLRVALPEIRSAADLPAASAAILDAVRRGELTSPEAVALNRTLAATREHFADADFARRLDALEAAQDAAGEPRHPEPSEARVGDPAASQAKT